MTISEFKDFIHRDMVYFVFPVVELSIHKTPRPLAQCIIARGKDRTLFASLYTQESVDQFRRTLDTSLRREAMILIDSIQGRIFTSFKPESGERFYGVAKKVWFKDEQLYSVHQIDDRNSFLEFLKSLIPDPQINRGEHHEHVG